MFNSLTSNNVFYLSHPDLNPRLQGQLVQYPAS